MGFGNEFRDFMEGWTAGERILSAREDRRVSRAKHPTDADTQANPGVFQPGQGPDVNTTQAPQAPQPSSRREAAGWMGGLKEGQASNAGGSNFLQRGYNYYQSRGVPPVIAAGIMGNLQHESGGDPRVLGGVRAGDNGSAWYAAQWRGDRYTNLLKFAQSRNNGKPTKPTEQDQLDFVLEEGNPNSPYANAGAVKAFDAMGNAKTAGESAKYFMDMFEAPNPKFAHFDSRSAAAEAVFGGKGGSYSANNVGPGAPSSGYPATDTYTPPAEPAPSTGAIPDDSASSSEDPALDDTGMGPGGDLISVPDAQVGDDQYDPEFVTYARRGGAIPDHY